MQDTLYLGLLAAAGLLLSEVQAQNEGNGAALAAPAIFDGRVPIHSLPDDPSFGPYGKWAAGPGYKVSFHDGLCIYPVLGAQAPRHLPLRWETASVRMGDTELLDGGPPIAQHDDWQFTYRFANVSEIYDVRADGVAQSFVVERPREVDGALEVVGRWTSPLRPVRDAVPGSVQGALRFVDDAGRDILRYGEAIALDATGRRIEVLTSVERDTIRLTVPATWARDAVWPITIDPLLSPELIGSFGSLASGITHSDVHGTFGAFTHRVMTTFSVPTTANDDDTYAVLTDDNMQNPALVFADLGSSIRSTHPRLAFVDFVGGTGRWTIAFERTALRAQTPSELRIWLHDGGDTTFQSGSMMSLPLTTPGWGDRRPDIGGSRNDSTALLVYESNLTSQGTVSDTTELHRVLVNAATGTFGTPALLDSVPVSSFSLQVDRAGPSVMQTSEGSPLGWMVCYLQRPLVPSNWIIRGRRIQSDGTGGPEATISTMTAGPLNNPIQVSVDGSNTRHGVAFLMAGSNAATSGAELRMTRFIWAPTSSVPTVQWTSTLDTAAAFGAFYEPRVTADVRIGNWAVAYRERRSIGVADAVRGIRVGFNGAVVESQTIYSSLATDGAAPSISYQQATSRFLVAYGTKSANSSVSGRVWSYPSSALNIQYGSTCGAAFGAVTTPLVGTEFFRVRLTGARPNSPATLLVGIGSANIDLGFIGMPTCRLLVNPTPIVAVPASTDALGNALTTIIGLTAPGDLYMQWLHAAPGANPIGLLATEGMKSQIR